MTTYISIYIVFSSEMERKKGEAIPGLSNKRGFDLYGWSQSRISIYLARSTTY
jgi:hypothetical protein